VGRNHATLVSTTPVLPATPPSASHPRQPDTLLPNHPPRQSHHQPLTMLQVDEVIIACFLSGVLSAAGMAAQNHKALKKSIPKSLGAFVVLLCAGLLVVATSPFPRPSRL